MYLKILNFLKLFKVGQYWKSLTIAFLLSIIAYQNFSDTRFFLWSTTIPYLKAELITQGVALDLANQSNELLRESIEERNALVEEQKLITEELERQFAQIGNELVMIRNSTNDKIRSVIRESTPETCTAAFEFLSNSIDELNFNDRN